jgi:hypothetical protein
MRPTDTVTSIFGVAHSTSSSHAYNGVYLGNLAARWLRVVSLTCDFLDKTKGLKFAAPIISMAQNDLLCDGMSDT